MSAAEPKAEMPMIQIGRYRVSRLVVGANPMLGYSYQGAMLGQFMLDYYTVDNMERVLRRCLDVGINTWQSSGHVKVDQTLERLRNSGRDIQWIYLGSYGEDANTLRAIIQRNHPIAIVNHGGVSDKVWREGQIEVVHDYAKRVQDLGVLAGMSAHNPDVIRHAEDRGWNLDLYMTCFYRLTRTPEEVAKAVGGEVPLWGSFLPGDPAKMCEAVRAVKRPCLAFKILGGGRRAERPEDTAASFEFAFRNIKPTDGVIVGLFPRFRDEAAEDAELTRRFSGLSG